MSIFSGLSPENLRIAFEAAKSSPSALAALLIALAFAVLAVGLAAAFVSRGIGGFHAHVLDEEEQAERAEPAPTSDEASNETGMSVRGRSFAASGAIARPSERSPQPGGETRNDEEES